MPAAAVIPVRQTVFYIIGREGYVDGKCSTILNLRKNLENIIKTLLVFSNVGRS